MITVNKFHLVELRLEILQLTCYNMVWWALYVF